MSQLQMPDKTGRWYVTWGKHRYYGSVFERNGEMWFREIPTLPDDTDILIRNDGGLWEPAPARYKDARP